MSDVVVTLGDLKEDYEVIDTIFVTAGSGGFFKLNSREEAYEKVKCELKQKCASMGGDAIIFLQFDYSQSSGGGMLATNFTAYGTVVKRKGR